MKQFALALSALVSIFGASSASAVAILNNAVGIDPVSAVSTSNYGAPYTTNRTIDQSDLSSGYVSGVTSTAIIDTFTNLSTGQGWHGGLNDTIGSITFDLGAQFTLDRVYLYWMNSGSANNIKNFSVEVGVDLAFTNSVIAANFGSQTAAQERVDFANLATGEFVRLNWTALQGSYPGLNEFIAGGIPVPATNDVPEPSSLLLMGAGLLAITRMRRR